VTVLEVARQLLLLTGMEEVCFTLVRPLEGFRLVVIWKTLDGRERNDSSSEETSRRDVVRRDLRESCDVVRRRVSRSDGRVAEREATVSAHGSDAGLMIGVEEGRRVERRVFVGSGGGVLASFVSEGSEGFHRDGHVEESCRSSSFAESSSSRSVSVDGS